MSKENEYELLAKHFNEIKIQEIKMTREDFDEKLKNQKNKSIYLDYIEFEREVVKSIHLKNRWDGRLIKLITEKVKSIYEEAMFHHESDPDILQGYLKLLLKNNYLHEAKTIIEKIKKNSYLISEDLENECFSDLPEDAYLLYLNDLTKDYKSSKNPDLETHIIKVYEKAVQRFNSSQKLWVSYLKFIFSSNETETKKNNFFKRSIAAIPNNTEDLWKLYILYKESLCSIDKPEMMIGVYKEAIKSQSSVSNIYKPVLIDYVANFIGITEAREIYKNLTEKANPCLELHMKMIDLEKFEEDDPKYLRKCFENATRLYGKSSVELWINYYNFDKNLAKPFNNIVEKAKESLTPEDFIKFQELLKQNNKSHEK